MLKPSCGVLTPASPCLSTILVSFICVVNEDIACSHFQVMPGVGVMVRVVGLGSKDLEFKSHSAVELIPGGIDCLSSFQGRQNECELAGILCRRATCPGLCPIAKETA